MFYPRKISFFIVNFLIFLSFFLSVEGFLFRASSSFGTKETYDEYIEEYIDEWKAQACAAPYTPTQGFLKHQLEKEALKAKKNYAYQEEQEGSDEKNVVLFVQEIVLPFIRPYMSKEVLHDISQMMAREREYKEFAIFYHGCTNTIGLLTEWNTELYRALGILEGEDTEHKVLRPFADIFENIKDIDALRRKYSNDHNRLFSERCLSCVPYIFGFHNTDSSPLGYWLGNRNFNVKLNFLEELEKIYKKLGLDSQITSAKEQYAKILEKHKFITWGGVFMQILVSPFDLVQANSDLCTTDIIAWEKNAYMCANFGHTWTQNWSWNDCNSSLSQMNEISANVLKTTLKTRQGLPQQWIHLHQLRYMPTEIPKAIYLYYADQRDEQVIQAFRKDLFNQIHQDIQQRPELKTQSLFFSEPKD